jgi:hypothetical protein
LDLKKQWDNYSALETAKNEGLAKGEHKKAIEMKKDGMPTAQISRYTKLTIEKPRRALRSKIEKL